MKYVLRDNHDNLLAEALTLDEIMLHASAEECAPVSHLSLCLSGAVYKWGHNGIINTGLCVRKDKRMKFTKLHDNATIPKYATSKSSGMDLHFNGFDTCLAPGQRALLSTGLSIELDPNTEAQIRSRSGLAAKQGLTVLNSPGTIDEDYTGQLYVLLYNASDIAQCIKSGQRIAQLVICPVIRYQEHVQENERGSGGFGSTGV